MHLLRWLAIVAAFSIPACRCSACSDLAAYAQRSFRDLLREAQTDDQRARALLDVVRTTAGLLSSNRRGWNANSSPPRSRFASSCSLRSRNTSPIACDPPPTPTTSEPQARIISSWAADDPAKFGLAAHEYAHLVLRASGSKLPPWLKEGLAEFFATLRITGRRQRSWAGRCRAACKRCSGGPGCRWRTCWRLSEESLRHAGTQRRTDLFYAESWALTEMLLLSPEYAPSFQKFSGAPAGLVEHGSSDGTYAQDLRINWTDLHAGGQGAPGEFSFPKWSRCPCRCRFPMFRRSTLRLLLAQVLTGRGRVRSRGGALSDLAHDAPDSADVSAALGVDRPA